MSDSKTLFLHIGSKKTGSTSIQHSIMTNSPQLSKQGIHITRLFGSLMANALYRLYRDAPSSPIESDLMKSFVSEIESQRVLGVENAIISCESLVDLKQEKVKLICKDLSALFDTVKVVLYIRRQDLSAVSHYSTGLRGGGVSTKLMSEKMGPSRRAFMYHRLLHDWGGCIGKDNLIVRIFEKPEMKNGNVVEDFYDIVGVPFDTVQDTPSLNTSLSPSAQAFLRLYNEVSLSMSDKIDSKPLSRLVQALEDVSGGKGMKPSRETAKSFYDEFREGNEKVRQEFFPARTTLFDEDFSMYSDENVDINDHATPEILMKEFIKIWSRANQS